MIYNETREQHIEHVFKILKKLQIVELYWNINKCEFFVQKVKYLKLIIIIDDIKINSKKIKVIFDWKSSRNIKNVQVFLNLTNFYKKFIMIYFKLVEFLIKFIKIFAKNFLYSWNFEKLEKISFKILKDAFTKISIFQHFDFDKEIWIEIDVFDYVVVAILFQMNFDKKLHSIAFFFKRMSFAECNYEIIDEK